MKNHELIRDFLLRQPQILGDDLGGLCGSAASLLMLTEGGEAVFVQDNMGRTHIYVENQGYATDLTAAQYSGEWMNSEFEELSIPDVWHSVVSEYQGFLSDMGFKEVARCQDVQSLALKLSGWDAVSYISLPEELSSLI
jgi:hypothetical protein